jgi:hypothetical protein
MVVSFLGDSLQLRLTPGFIKGRSIEKHYWRDG